MKPVLALDFDGVVSDSAPEAYLVALRTYVALRPRLMGSMGSKLAGELATLDELAASDALDHATITSRALYTEFVALMPLGNRAEDYGVVLHAIEVAEQIRDQADYDRHRGAQARQFLVDYHARFYAERDAFAAADPAGWQRLLGPYPEFIALLRRRASDARLGLATAKDRASVERLLAGFGIADLFEPELVLDKEAGTSKRAHLEALRERTRSDFSAITFVDDKVNHLEDVAELGVRCALAAWGYNGERERSRARACGFCVCTLADAEAQLFPRVDSGTSSLPAPKR